MAKRKRPTKALMAAAEQEFKRWLDGYMASLAKALREAFKPKAKKKPATKKPRRKK